MQTKADTTSGAEHPALLLGVLAFCALLVYLAMNSLMVGEVVGGYSSRGFAKSLVYAVWIAGGFVTLSAVLLTARVPVLVAVLIVCCISLGTNYAYSLIAERDITSDLMEWMAHEVSQLQHAWLEFTPQILYGTARAVGLLALLLVIRAVIHRRRLLASHLLYARRSRAIALAAFLAFHIGTMLLQPSYAVAETNVFVFGAPAMMVEAPKPRTAAAPPNRPRAQKIVFVIDESVGSKVFAQVVAPTLAGVPALNFGETASIATCSAPSNALLRWGLERPLLGRSGYDPRTNPTIWGYAKAAGFRTMLIDGQSKGTIQNFVTSGELALIDEFVGADTGIDTDARIARLLRDRLARPGPELIYVVKRGAHFPYEANYPAGTVAPDATRQARYAAAVAYSTAGFFADLTQSLPLADLFLIYTSDHGQNLESRAVHCSAEHHPDEYSTPLLAVTGAPQMLDLLRGSRERMTNRTSHLNIFPTLLYALGYEQQWVEATYGATLAGPPSPYVTLAWHLPYPSRRTPVVEFTHTDHFPGRLTAR
jgi:hypothetical protein